MRIQPIHLVPALLLGSTLAFAASPRVQSRETSQDAARAYWQDVARVLDEQHTVRSVYPPDPRQEKMRRVLATTVIPELVVKDAEHLGPVLSAVYAQTGLPIHVDHAATELVSDEGVLFNFNLQHPLPVDHVLDIIAGAAGDEVVWTIMDGAVFFTTRERAQEERVIFFHPVADLFPTFQEDDVAVLIQENVKVGSWEEDGVSIEPHGAFLIIVHTVAAQLECEGFFSDLRRFRNGMSSGETTLETRLGDREAVGVLAELEAVRFAPIFGVDGQGTHLTEIAAFLQQLTGVNFVVAASVLDDLDSEELEFVLTIPERNVRKFLDFLVSSQGELAWRVEHGVVEFILRSSVSGGQTLALHDIRELVFPEDRAFAVTGDDEPGARVLEGDMLEDLIRNNIAPDSWDEDPGNSLRISDSGVMVVNQRPEVQQRIRALLDDLSEIARVMRETRAGYDSDR